MIWDKVKYYLALLLMGLTVLFSVRRAGQQVERVKTMETTINAAKKKNEIHTENNARPDGAAARELQGKWSRD